MMLHRPTVWVRVKILFGWAIRASSSFYVSGIYGSNSSSRVPSCRILEAEPSFALLELSLNLPTRS
jgi:hypothetical protein